MAAPEGEGQSPQVTDGLRFLTPLPDEGVPMAVVEIVDYIDGDGDHAYAFRFAGTESVASVVGLLEVAKHRLLDDSYYPDAHDDDED